MTTNIYDQNLTSSIDTLANYRRESDDVIVVDVSVKGGELVQSFTWQRAAVTNSWLNSHLIFGEKIAEPLTRIKAQIIHLNKNTVSEKRSRALESIDLILTKLGITIPEPVHETEEQILERAAIAAVHIPQDDDSDDDNVAPPTPPPHPNRDARKLTEI
ncbi:MAG: hypothetical protein SP4CHLAM5_08730 [Chlamydiia bacterium]|nr:hypothetical protein [Chlamydiia bacterium]MCH9618736.1 hypothetical protein [Chlamydiia bacterium]MCH9624524.1 hypothetical protein [Chlamydiia bacterium]